MPRVLLRVHRSAAESIDGFRPAMRKRHFLAALSIALKGVKLDSR